MKRDLSDYEYLLHHIEGEEGKEEVHHCFVLDHIGNLFEQGHLIINSNGEAYYKGQKVVGRVFHIIAGLEPTQDVCWSNTEAEENKIRPKEIKAGMTYEDKSKEW